MSLFDRFFQSKRHIILCAALAGTSLLTACQVKPLYGTSTGRALPAIEISDADTRLEQVVRNELVFLTGNSSGQPASEYSLVLNVSRSAAGLLDSGTNNNFTAGRMTATGTYILTRLSDGKIIKKGSRKAEALYDLPDQEFSKIRALQDAENRAGRELAHFISADIAAALNQ